ncbi:pyruvate dehydrogenase E1 component subunit alpha, mitochondrial-like isoform X2 [Drosophila tropicalis]|uniref:pyruvate dehydrogenase E1 component subunit alpha, mitochondrial-like isoform X2 n=1 Tax=Drosophila tropicalis TaxID=46794 RepID=UPI0035AC0C30
MIMLKQGGATLSILTGVSREKSALQVRRLLAICKRGACKEWLNRRHKSETSNNNSTLTLENCYDLETGPPMDVELSREDALSMYTKMVEVRRLEIIAAEFYKQKKIRGFCHLYNGQEAVAVGMTSVMRKMDSVITAYRCHAWTYLMGVSMYAQLAELLGVRTGCSRGKGGSMHMYGDNYYGGNGIVGAQVPLGAGIALAHRYKDDDGVCIICYGDGAANQGQIFEAFNMAKLWCLPCIFVCENNEYGMGTETSRASANTDFYMRGQYIPGLWVDGNQVLAVRSATQFAIDFVQSNGPIVLEMFTYRYMGHSMSDPGTSYRTRDEVQNVRETRDPITNFRNQVVRLCLACEEELKQIDDTVKKQMGLDVKKALQDREVDEHELTADVYAKNVEPRIRGVSGYNLQHYQVAEVCLGKPKPTPAKEIKDVPVGDAALLAAQAGKMKKDGKKTDKAADDDKTKPPTKEGEKEKSQANAKVPPAEGVTKTAGTTAPPATTAPLAAPPGKTPAAPPGKAPGAPAGKAPASKAGKAVPQSPAKPPAATPAKTPARAPGKATAAPAPSAKPKAAPQTKNPPATSPSAPPKTVPPGSGGAPKSPPPKNKTQK